MDISLPQNLKEFVKERTLNAHYGTPSDYIRGLIREDLKRLEQERLEQELLKGLRSDKSIPMTKEAWKRLPISNQTQPVTDVYGTITISKKEYQALKRTQRELERSATKAGSRAPQRGVRSLSPQDGAFLKLAEPSFDFWNNADDALYDRSGV